MLKQLGRSAFVGLFANQPFRKKAIFHLKQHFFQELGFYVELGNGYRLPISEQSAGYSFTEIFFEDEYASVFAEINLPERWLDLGCHFGFFSLYVAWMRAKHQLSPRFNALLIDADSRVQQGVLSLIQLNNLGSQLAFRHGAISLGTGFVDFQEQDVMSSALADISTDSPSSDKITVPIIDQLTIIEAMPPPYDLVKIDVEGGEYDFLSSYGNILANTQNLVLEWHSWHPGGGSADQIQAMAESHGFRFRKEIQVPKSCGVAGSNKQVGVFLFSKVI